MIIGVWIGLVMGFGLIAYGIGEAGALNKILNTHGLIIVLGGTTAAMLINTPIRNLMSAIARLFWILLPSRLPSPDQAIDEVVRLARTAQTGGGLLSLQDESTELADGFLHRAITVAISEAESHQIRTVCERQIKQIRIGRQEDANIYRTISVLSPMFGILGTLLGMIQVLGSLTDPSKVGPSMATALSSAFLGISVANFICVPIAGQIRLAAQRETLILEILLEGVLDIAAGKAPYIVELHLASYSERRRDEMRQGAGGGARATAPAEA